MWYLVSSSEARPAKFEEVSAGEVRNMLYRIIFIYEQHVSARLTLVKETTTEKSSWTDVLYPYYLDWCIRWLFIDHLSRSGRSFLSFGAPGCCLLNDHDYNLPCIWIGVHMRLFLSWRWTESFPSWWTVREQEHLTLVLWYMPARQHYSVVWEVQLPLAIFQNEEYTGEGVKS